MKLSLALAVIAWIIIFARAVYLYYNNPAADAEHRKTVALVVGGAEFVVAACLGAIVVMGFWPKGKCGC